jgi:hypothetical protein
MEKVEKGVVGCTIMCAAPCLGLCMADTVSPVLDAVGTTSGYYTGYKS